MKEVWNKYIQIKSMKYFLLTKYGSYKNELLLKFIIKTNKNVLNINKYFTKKATNLFSITYYVERLFI